MTGAPAFDRRVLTADPDRRQPIIEVMEAALAAVDPYEVVLRALTLEGDVLRTAHGHYPLHEIDRIRVMGAGKAGAPMAQAVETLLGDRITEGLVVVKDDHTAPTARIELVESSHPVPSDRGVAAGRRILQLAHASQARDLVITLLSGGGSALLVAPAAGVTLEDLQSMTALLLQAGATINEINCLRKHCSAIKGGQLARAVQPARLLTLAVSDVIGSPLDVIASGPTVPDSSTWRDAWDIVEKFQLEPLLPASIQTRLRQGLEGEIEDTPAAGDPAFAGADALVVADNRAAAVAAAQKAEALGFPAHIMTTFLEGEAREVAKVIVGFAREAHSHGNPTAPPGCLIFGGETTVTLQAGSGLGGRNQELGLAAGFALRDFPPAAIAFLATDGTDGPTDSAGALVDCHTIQRGLDLNLNPRRHLDAHDAYPFLAATGDMLKTGPTFTNVNDLALVFLYA